MNTSELRAEVDELGEAFSVLASTVSKLMGLRPTDDMEDLLEQFELRREDPFLARAYYVHKRHAASVAEANPDAIRLWVIPRPKAWRYSAAIEWLPSERESEERGI